MRWKVPTLRNSTMGQKSKSDHFQPIRCLMKFWLKIASQSKTQARITAYRKDFLGTLVSHFGKNDFWTFSPGKWNLTNIDGKWGRWAFVFWYCYSAHSIGFFLKFATIKKIKTLRASNGNEKNVKLMPPIIRNVS